MLLKMDFKYNKSRSSQLIKQFKGKYESII